VRSGAVHLDVRNRTDHAHDCRLGAVGEAVQTVDLAGVPVAIGVRRAGGAA
jgi:hypothetical protein